MGSACNSYKTFYNWNNQLINGLKYADIANLINLSIVGSYLNDKKIYSINDIDIVCIFSEFDVQEFTSLSIFMANLANTLSSANIIVSVEMRSGPLKPDISHDNILKVQLHILAYSLQDWLRVVKYPGCAEWLNNNYLIYGTALSELGNYDSITFDAIMRDIIVLQRNIDTQTAYCRVYKRVGNNLINEMEEVLLNDEQFAQLLISSFFFLFKNAENVWQISNNSKMPIRWPMEFIKLHNKVSKIKLQLKNGDCSAIEKALAIKKNIYKFLLWVYNSVLISTDNK